MVGEQQLNAAASRLDSLRRGDLDLHAFGDRVYTAGHKASRAGCLYETYAAGALIALAVVKGTQGRYLVAAGFRRFQDGQTGLYLVGYTFNFNIDQGHYLYLLSHTFEIALNLQELMQEPHFTHLDASIAMEASLCFGAM